MPTESIRPELMNYKLTEDNYTNNLSVYTTLGEGEYIRAEIIHTVNGQEVVTSLNTVTEGDSEAIKDMACYVKVPMNATNNYSRCEFIVKQMGTYRIVLKKCDKDGNVLKENGEDVSVTIYESFSHSEEYDEIIDAETVQDNLNYLAERAGGSVIEDLEDPVEVFKGFITAIPKVFDPRMLFIILAIIFFLMDIAVRKFKWKWLHEIIRDRRIKKEMKAGKRGN